MKIAVNSGIRMGRVIPICLYHGTPNRVTHELERMGVKVVHHDAFQFGNTKFKEVVSSRPVASLLLQQIDLSNIVQIRYYHSIMFSDHNIMFLDRINFDHMFETYPYPPCLSMRQFENRNLAPVIKNHALFTQWTESLGCSDLSTINQGDTNIIQQY